MTSIGDKLRRQREQSHASLEDISARTKIGVRLLAAIETEQFDKLPGGVFRKSFVLQYARALGLDPAEIAEELRHHSQFEEQPSIPGQEAPRLGSDMGVIAQSAPGRDWASLLGGSFGALLAAVAVILACAGLYSWWQRPTRQPEVAAAVSREPAPPPQASPPAEPPPSAAAPQAQPVSAPVTATPGFQNSQHVRVELMAGEATWVSASSDGRNVFTDSLQPRQTKNWEAVNKIRLLIGNAGGVEISLNGKPIGPIGPRGQVRIVELTPDGFQIVSRKPPTPEPL